MSLAAMNWVYREAQIPLKTERGEPNPGVMTAVLLCLADGYTDETGLAFRSVLNIAKMTRFDEKTVRTAMRALARYGLIREAEDQSVVAAVVKRSDRRPTGYELLFDGPDLCANGGASNPPAVKQQVKRGGERPPRKSTGGRAARDGGASDPRRGGEPPDKQKKNSRLNARGGYADDATTGSTQLDAPHSSETSDVVMGGVSVGRRPSRAATEEPAAAPVLSRFCARHPEGTERSCRACQSAREAFEAAEAARVAAVKADRAAARVSARDAKIRAIKACDCCDDRGYRLDDSKSTCNHVPDQRDVNRRGMANARAELARKKAS